MDCFACFLCCRSPKSQSGSEELHHNSTDTVTSEPARARPKSARASERTEKVRDMYNKAAPKAMGTLFETVRILVVGRSGSGKSTLIGRLLGKDVPRPVARNDGLAGVQDINVEWKWTVDTGIPLIILDSNGMDVRGSWNLDTVDKFLKSRMRSRNISDHIHLIWYVINGIDNRFADDGDLMATVANAEVPILLIITHNDAPKMVKQNVTPEALTNLFRSLRSNTSADIRSRMVYVDNGPESDQVNNTGLLEISEKSNILLDKHLRYTWIAAQAVDLLGKLDATTNLILETGKRILQTDLLLSQPQPEFESLLTVMHGRICKIWGVPLPLKNALSQIVVAPPLQAATMSQGFRKKPSTLHALIQFVGFLVTFGATVATVGLNVAGITGVNVRLEYSNLDRDGAAKTKCNLTWEIFSTGLRLMLAVLFLQSRQSSKARRQHRWNEEMEETEWEALCHEYDTRDLEEQWVENFLDKLRKESSRESDEFLRKVFCRPKTMSYFISNFAVEQYDHYMLTRPDSLQSNMQRENEETTFENCGPRNATKDNTLELAFLGNETILSIKDIHAMYPSEGTQSTNELEPTSKRNAFHLEEYYRPFIQNVFPYCVDFIEMMLS